MRTARGRIEGLSKPAMMSSEEGFGTGRCLEADGGVRMLDYHIFNRCQRHCFSKKVTDGHICQLSWQVTSAEVRS